MQNPAAERRLTICGLSRQSRMSASPPVLCILDPGYAERPDAPPPGQAADARAPTT